ncbi:MAG: hypothetical protein KGP14_14265, partial [Betaproteobacteria bacterium]|nr:hypothetical protein [Betaproteobacteria bacterium]
VYHAGIVKFNVVQIDGPGGFGYGIAGNESDATGIHPANRRRHYLDLFGDDAIYQGFTSTCEGMYDFGAYFSGRQNGSGPARVEIVAGTNPSAVAIASAATIPGSFAGPSQTGPWRLVSGQFSAPHGAPYLIRIRLSDNMSVDEVFVRPQANCR